jgi:trehalose 6-phosphate phosphatase
MNQNLGDLDVAEMPLHKDVASAAEASPTNVPAPGELAHWDQCAILLDIDGTLLDLAPTPREVWVPPGLAKSLNRLLVRTSGALALVSGRSLNDIDLIFHDISRSVTFWIYEPQTHQLGGTITPYIARH